MKRIIPVILLVAFVFIIWGCKSTTPMPSTPTPPANPNNAGCGCTVQALGNNLVAGLTWTNASTGTGGSSASTIYPQVTGSGAVVNVYADPSIACATNEPNVCIVTWKCKTNAPVYQFWVLPSGCSGFQRTINGDCSSCSFQVSQAIGASCFIQAPGKK